VARQKNHNDNIMTQKLLFILTFGLSIFSADGQDFSTYIKNNAVRTDKLDNSKNEAYNLLANFKLIMIGEMHGTNEPAKFVIQLTELLASNNDSVQVGLEIPPDLMTKYISSRSVENIYASDFFADNSKDGRASFAWAEIIAKLNKNSKVRIFFYDTIEGESKTYEDRDSLMYLKIKKEIKLFPNWKTITLSGNIHNMILPYKGKPKTALYLIKDSELNLSKNICTLNHYSQSGKMLNNIGNGLQISEVNNTSSPYSQSVDFDSYLLLFPENHSDRYNGIYFTRTVSAAKMVGH
jgi:hypothetical protein